MVDFIDDHRGTYGVESICEMMPIAPSTYYQHRARRRDPELRSRELAVEVRDRLKGASCPAGLSATALGELLQPLAPRGDERELDRDEQRVQREQNDSDYDGERRHRAPPSVDPPTAARFARSRACNT